MTVNGNTIEGTAYLFTIDRNRSKKKMPRIPIHWSISFFFVLVFTTHNVPIEHVSPALLRAGCLNLIEQKKKTMKTWLHLHVVTIDWPLLLSHCMLVWFLYKSEQIQHLYAVALLLGLWKKKNRFTHATVCRIGDLFPRDKTDCNL